MSDNEASLQGQSPDAPKIKYRLVFLSQDGQVQATESIDADCDERAVSVAQSKVDGHAVELWDGLRFIEHFDSIHPAP